MCQSVGCSTPNWLEQPCAVLLVVAAICLPSLSPAAGAGHDESGDAMSLSWLLLAPAPALRGRRHRCLACRLVAVGGSLDRGRRVAARPTPRPILRCDLLLGNASDHDAVLQHVVIVVAPLPRRTRGRGALEDQWGHGLSDQTRRATQRRLKPPEWQQAQSQQEASRSLPHLFRAAVAAAVAFVASVVAASAASQLSPFEPPQQEERTSPADDCGRENVKPSSLLVCHRHRPRRGAAPERRSAARVSRRDASRGSCSSAIARVGNGPSM
jgi:hypothetical protein